MDHGKPKKKAVRPRQAQEAERYELTWAGKDRCIRETAEPPRCFLHPCLDGSVDWENTRNVYIEGDNLQALKLLRQSHANAVKLIYIDPPYNTGGGFVYQDDFAAGRDGAHAVWLSMMYPRLVLARGLLRDDGAIFISISENELFGLKLICDDIFGGENYLTMFSVRVRHEGRILKGDKDYHEVMEYLLLYRKSKAFHAPKQKARSSLNDYVWRVEELSDAPETAVMDNKTVQIFRPGQYRIARKEAGESLLRRISIRGALKEGNSSGRFYMKHLDAYTAEKGLLFKVPGIGDDGLGFRYFLTPETQRRRNGDYFQGVPRRIARTVPYPNFLDFERAFNRVGFEGGVEFRNGKKPVAFLEKILEMAGLREEDGLVLDFFAGSATTAHAVMKCNMEHGRGSSFIMVQLDEDLDEALINSAGETRAAARRAIDFLDGIGAAHRLSELGKERLRRAGVQLCAQAAAAGLPPADTGFQVFRLAPDDVLGCNI
jgi:adenine-specific DNA-methyltransferase